MTMNILPAFLLAAMPISDPTGSVPPTVASRVDHIIIRADDPEPLFELLTETFELPVAWPMRSYGAFVSGGVYIGGANLEVVRMGNADADEPRLFGIAFEPAPSMAAALNALDERDVNHGSAMPFHGQRPDGTSGVLWTNASLTALGVPDAWLFLCEYTFDVQTDRQRNRTDLEARDGGPVGLHELREIVIGVQDASAAASCWEAHFGHPTTNDDDVLFQLDSGPAIRLVPAERDGLLRLLLVVASVDRVRQTLAETDVRISDVAEDEPSEAIDVHGGILGRVVLRFTASPAEPERSKCAGSCKPRISVGRTKPSSLGRSVARYGSAVSRSRD